MPPVNTFFKWLKKSAPAAMKLPRNILICLLFGYKYVISPLFPPACRFEPTCSRYAIEAITKYGAIRGGVMALRRILRCHPFSRGGYDPVR